MRESKQSQLDHVRSLLKAALGRLPQYADDDDEIQALVDWAEGTGCSIEEVVTAEAKAIIQVTAHLHGGKK